MPAGERGCRGLAEGHGAAGHGALGQGCMRFRGIGEQMERGIWGWGYSPSGSTVRLLRVPVCCLRGLLPGVKFVWSPWCHPGILGRVSGVVCVCVCVCVCPLVRLLLWVSQSCVLLPARFWCWVILASSVKGWGGVGMGREGGGGRQWRGTPERGGWEGRGRIGGGKEEQG